MALPADRTDEPLREGIQVRTLRRQANGLDASVAKELSGVLREHGITVHEDVGLAEQESVEGIGQVPEHLFHPGAMWPMNDAGDLDQARLEIDHEQDVVAHQAMPGEDLDREEIGGRKRAPVSVEELLPREAFEVSVIGGDAGFDEDPLDRGRADGVPDTEHGAGNADVSPGEVFESEPHDEVADLLSLAWPPRLAWHFGAVVLGGDELAKPASTAAGVKMVT